MNLKIRQANIKDARFIYDLRNDLLSIRYSLDSKKIDYKAFSSSHPMHVYTYSAKDILVLPSGTYNIRIRNN